MMQMPKFPFTILSLLIACTACELRAEDPHARPLQTPAEATALNHPFFRTALYPEWSKMTHEQAMADVKAALLEARERLSAIAAVTPESATFENTFLAWYKADENMKQLANYLSHLQMATGSPAVQRMMYDVHNEIMTFKAEGVHATRIAEVLREAGEAPWVAQLSPARQRFVQQMLASMRNSGLYLTIEQQERRAAIEAELSRLGYRFSLYVKQAPQLWELLITNPAELAGMPPRWMQAAEAAAKGRGEEGKPAWLVNLTTAPASAVLRYCTVAETRKKCWLGTVSAGTPLTLDTAPIITRILELRHELASLLGYANYADMQAAQRMMGSGENALAFVNEMLHQSKPAWDAYVAAEMQRFSRACGQELSAVNPWDVEFLNTQLPPERSSFNVNVITPYLQPQKVLAGLMNIWAGLLSVQFEELPTACIKPGECAPAGHVETWHPEVRCFAVKDTATGHHLGSFYLDIYSRPGKRPQAWCLPLRDGEPAADGGPGEPHLAALMANFAPPQQGQPHLMSHGDLYMLFHEFGHMMHMMLGHGELRAHCTAEVERDFVETPSQLQESWIWEPAALATFTSHYQTGAPLPAELAEKLAATRGSNPIEMHMRMLFMSKLDLELHMHYHDKYKGRQLDEVCRDILSPWLFPYTMQPPSEMRTLTHCMTDGYAAALYTYKWSEMLAADAMQRFQNEGIFNPATGADYRRCILSRGSSVPAMQQIRDFLGRDPAPAALIQRYTRP